MGVVIIGLAVYYFVVEDLEITRFLLLMITGGVAFYFENEVIKKYLKKFINLRLKK